MGNTNYVSLSLAVALQRSLDVSAHNLANAGTAGYKSAQPIFESMVNAATESDPDAAISYVQDKGDYIDKSQGALTRTDNPLDVALSGAGWFAYESLGGQTAFGRDGRLMVSGDGSLSTLSGARILGPGGSAITLPAESAGQISIARDGTITSFDGAVLGEIGVFQAPSSTQLTAIGGGLYLPKNSSDASLIPMEDFKIAQGFIENSNVQPVLEMTKMMEIQRAYERSINLMSGENDLTRQAIQRLGRVI